MIFKKYFEVLICDNEESKKIHHNNRHKVYCEELGWTHQDVRGECWSGNFRDWVQYRQLIPNNVKRG